MYSFTSTSNKPSLISSNLSATPNNFQPSNSSAFVINSVSNTSNHFRTPSRRLSILQRSELLGRLNRENQKTLLSDNCDSAEHSHLGYEMPNLRRQSDMVRSFLHVRGMPHCAEPNLSNIRRYLSEVPAEISAKVEGGVERLHLAAVHFQEISQILTSRRLTSEEKDRQVFDLCGIKVGLTCTATPDAHLGALHKLEECLTKCFAMNFHSVSNKGLLMLFDFGGRTHLDFIHRCIVNTNSTK